MKKYFVAVALLIALSLLAAQCGMAAISPAVVAQDEVKAIEVGTKESAMDHLSADHSENELSGQSQVFQVVVVAYLLDTAGFHGLDERLNDTGEIQAGDAGMVNRINRVLAHTAWPETLQEPAGQLNEVLTLYATALTDDDIEAAKPLATQAHEAQHDLSHAIQEWLAESDMAPVAEHEHQHSN